MSGPEVSVVIPAYNYGRFLTAAVHSAREQVGTEMEIIVVDDGSTDDTEDVVRRLEGPVRYVKQRNAGPAAARNCGVALARGEFVAFLDADDYWLAGKMQRQLDVLRMHAEIGVCHSAFEVVEDTTLRRRPGRYWGTSGIHPTLDELLLDFCVNMSTVVVRRSLLERVGGFDARLGSSGEDWNLWIRLALSDVRFYYVNETLVVTRHHGENVHVRKDPELQRRHTESMVRSLEREYRDQVPAWWLERMPSLLHFFYARACFERGEVLGFVRHLVGSVWASPVFGVKLFGRKVVRRWSNGG